MSPHPCSGSCFSSEGEGTEAQLLHPPRGPRDTPFRPLGTLRTDLKPQIQLPTSLPTVPLLDQPPAQPGPPTLWQGGQTEGSPRTRLPSPLLPHRTFHRERWNLHSEKLLPSTGTLPEGSWGCLLLLLADPGGLSLREPLGGACAVRARWPPFWHRTSSASAWLWEHPCYAETLLQLKETGDHLALPSPG